MADTRSMSMVRKGKEKSQKSSPVVVNDSVLLKDLTRYGTNVHRLGEILYYSSDRTVAQYKRMRMNPMCWLGLNFIKLGLNAVPFNVDCTEDDDVKAIAEVMLKKIWNRMFRDALEKLDYGFKAMEIRWEGGTLKYTLEEKQKKFTGHLFKQPRSLDGETIEILVEPGIGTLRGFRQDFKKESDCLVEERKALLFVKNLESGNFHGISALEPSFPYWYDSNLNRQFHMRWLERKGTGFFKGWYPDGETEVDGAVMANQQIMLDLLDSIMEGNAIALPSDRDEAGNLLWDIEFMSDQDKTNPFLERSNYIDEMILKSLIIPEKALTQGEVGARASIESFQNMFIQRKQDILDETVEAIDKYYLPHFIEVNFGKDIEIHVTAGKLDDNSKETAGKIVEKLLDKDKIKVDVMWLVDKTGIPMEEQEPPEPIIPPDLINNNGEDDAGSNSQKEDGQNPGDKDKGSQDKGDKKDLNPKGKGKEDDKKEVKKMADPGSRGRAFNKAETRNNLSSLESSLDRRADQFRAEMTGELKTQADRIKRYLDKNYNADGKSALVAQGIEVKVNPIRKLFRDYLKDIYNYSYETIQSGIEGTIKFTSADPYNQFITFRVDVTAEKFAKDFESALK